MWFSLMLGRAVGLWWLLSLVRLLAVDETAGEDDNKETLASSER